MVIITSTGAKSWPNRHKTFWQLDGVQSNITRQFYNVVWKALDEADIPYTFHWGKINNLDRDKVRNMYGNEVDRWIQAGNQILPPAGMKLFANQTFKEWGLEYHLANHE